jgi:SAM-dependent methyltransferase
MAQNWTADALVEVLRGHQPACVLAAAVDFDVFGHLAVEPRTAAQMADLCGADRRGMTALLNALVALELLEKRDEQFAAPPDVTALFNHAERPGLLATLRHQANCLRRWAQLSAVVQSGRPVPRSPSVRGAEADQAAFIEAMHWHSAPLADRLVTVLRPLSFKHLLDVGGATGTWTAALLRAVPEAVGTLFDLPAAMPLARQRIVEEGLAERVQLVAGDFYTDDLPGGVDFAWLGAIVHQNSRSQNRALFRKVYAALVPGGQVVLRDVVMDASHTQPPAGALFAINMLVATEGGGTFSFEELCADIEACGFRDPELLRHGQFMDSLVRATKPV